MNSKSERFELRLEAEAMERIDNWRRDQPDLPNRSEAARRLIEIGLGKPEDSQLFRMARLNVLSAYKTSGPDRMIPDAYAYAWSNRIYPLFHDDHIQMHQPFASHFIVTSDMIHELSKFLDDRWLARKDMPTFYQLEDRYETRERNTPWDRWKLIQACRYMFLNKLFDDSLWSALRAKGQHPSEASLMLRKFEASDITL